MGLCEVVSTSVEREVISTVDFNSYCSGGEELNRGYAVEEFNMN